MLRRSPFLLVFGLCACDTGGPGSSTPTEKEPPAGDQVTDAQDVETSETRNVATDGVAYVATSAHEVCVGYTDGAFRCASVSRDGAITPISVGGISPDTATLSSKLCFAEGTTIRCQSLSDPSRLTHELSLPFPPVELFVLYGRVGPNSRRGPDEVCGRSDAGEVRCVTLADEAKERRLFERSTAIRTDGRTVFSLRDDGRLECLGEGSCTAMLAAAHPATGPGGGGVDEGVRPGLSAPPPDPTADLAATWPGALEKLAPVTEKPFVIPLGPFRGLIDSTPCAFEADGAVSCWARHRAPWRVPAIPSGVDHFTWGLRLCARGDDEVRCTQLEDQRPPITIPAPDLARAFAVGRSLCTLTRDRELACRSEPNAKASTATF